MAGYAARLYPRETYATVTGADASASCIATALLRDPPRGFERYYQRVAICSPIANTRVYELILSEMNLAGKEPIPGLEEAALEFIESLRFP